jgi:hypothetical protein
MTDPKQTHGLVPVRDCDGCTLCCKLMGVGALEKPKGKWCLHCKIGAGCEIHPTRPEECRTFYCAYTMDREIGDHWKPSESKLILCVLNGDGPGDIARLEIHVDPSRADAWRQQPYFSEIKAWSKGAAVSNSQVTVHIGAHVWAILPDREVDLGECREDEIVATRTTRTPAGATYEAFKLHRDDPRAQNFKTSRTRSPIFGGPSNSPLQPASFPFLRAKDN